MKQFLGIGLIALAAATAGYFSARWLSAPDAEAIGTSAALLGQERTDFTLPGLDGQPRTLSEWDGKVILLNFWATWCKPCVEEMPMLNEFNRRYADEGFQVIGVAMDQPVAVRRFIEELGITYPILIDQMDAETIMGQYGSPGVLPYSVLIQRDGAIARQVLGKIDAQALSAALDELL